MVRARSLVIPALVAALVVSLAALHGRAAVQDAPKGDAKKDDSKKAEDKKADAKATDSKKADAKKGDAKKDEAEATPIEQRPYKIRTWIVIDPKARIDTRGRARLVEDWLALVKRFVGPPWVIEVAEGPGPLGGRDLLAVKSDATAKMAEGQDKAWLVLVEPVGNGFAFSGREYDVRSGRMGQPYRRVCPWPVDAPRTLFQLATDMFSPSANVGTQAGGGVTITVQGAALPVADPAGNVVSVGSYFRPLRVMMKLDGKTVVQVQEINFSFLRVEAINGPEATCSIISGLRNPLTVRVRGGKAALIALGVKPAHNPSHFRFVEGPQRDPAAGYVLTAKPFPKGTPYDVGTTDREGRVTLGPEFADGLVIMQLLAGNVEPLVQFPWMPGETPVEKVIPIIPKPEAVALGTAVNALRDEVFDLVGRRRRLLKRLANSIAGETADVEVAKAAIKEYRTLPDRKAYDDRLNKLKTEAGDTQRKTGKPILTASVQRLIRNAQDLIDRYLDDSEFDGYVDAVDGMAGPSKGRAKPASTTPAKPSAPVTTPPPPATTPAAASGSRARPLESAGAWREFAPKGAGFRVLMPGTPKEQKRRLEWIAGPYDLIAGGPGCSQPGRRSRKRSRGERPDLSPGPLVAARPRLRATGATRSLRCRTVATGRPATGLFLPSGIDARFRSDRMSRTGRCRPSTRSTNWDEQR